MQVIGLIGGMSWESTLEYYRIINQTFRERLGGQHSAKILLYSVDFQEIETMQRDSRWEEAGRCLADAAGRIERGGADFVLLCTNTMHRVAPQIQEAVSIPLLHIADATAEEVKAAGLTHVGLLGTRFTMEQDFYRERMESRHSLRVTIPDEKARAAVHRIIYEELCLGRIREVSKSTMVRIIEDLIGAGAEGVVLGCTELSLLVRPEDLRIAAFDTTRIHARKAVDWALE
jgi:aspartate racemase